MSGFDPFGWAWEQELAPAPKVVLMTLAELADRTGTCRVTVKELSERTVISARALHDTLAKLEAAGLLRRRFVNGTASAYRLNFGTPFSALDLFAGQDFPPLPGPTGAAVGRLRRTLRMAAARRLGTHTDEEWQALVAACGGVCVECFLGPDDGRWVTKDHILSVAAGGSDSIDNIQPLCRPCNAAKRDRPGQDLRPTGWREAML